MPRTAITVRTLTRQGVLISDASTYVLVDRANGMQMVNDGRTFLAFQNINGATSYDMAFRPNPLLLFDGTGAPPSYIFTSPANSQKFLGPFPRGKYGELLLMDVNTVGAETNVRVTAFSMAGSIPLVGRRVIPVNNSSISPRVTLALNGLGRAVNGFGYGSGSGETAIDNTNGHAMPNDGQAFVHIRNTGAGTMVMFMGVTFTRDGQSGGNVNSSSISLPTGKEALVGPFPQQLGQVLPADMATLSFQGNQTGFIKAYWTPFED